MKETSRFPKEKVSVNNEPLDETNTLLVKISDSQYYLIATTINMNSTKFVFK